MREELPTTTAACLVERASRPFAVASERARRPFHYQRTGGTPVPLKIAGRRAFTLIELILVMALLVAMISVTAPSLFSFFRGRALDSEARRLLSLTRAGQSRAVSEGLPMLLWIDTEQSAYGLEQEMPPRDGDPKALEFSLEDGLLLEAQNTRPVPVHGRNLPAIRFTPEGLIDESSPTALRLGGVDNASLWLVETTNRVSYEIHNTDH